MRAVNLIPAEQRSGSSIENNCSHAPRSSDALVSQMVQTQVTDSEGVKAVYRFNPDGFTTDVTATQGQTHSRSRSCCTAARVLGTSSPGSTRG